MSTDQLQTITHRWTGAVLFSLACSSLKLCMESAVEARTNLESANLRGANLRGADLGGADLRGADLWGANLRGADLWGADLRSADLGGADLRGADLGRTDLRGANLGSADLRGADLGDAELQGADLRGAELRGADLGDAELQGANLSAIQVARLSIVPETGAFEGWKKCLNGVLVHVRIPAEAPRSNATGRKCRAAYVDVVAIEGADGAVSQYDFSVIYRVGERVTCHEWDPNRWEECGGGIHFFLTRAEAEAY